MILHLIFYLFAILIDSSNSFPTISDTCNLQWNKTGITILENVTSGVTYLQYPLGLHFDMKSEILYITDAGHNRILKLYPNGKVETAAGQADGTGGSTDSTLGNPVHAIADENENIYIADWTNHRVQYWEKNAKRGRTVAGNGNPGDALNQFRYPGRVVLDSQKNIIVVDTQNERITKWPSISASNRSNIQIMAGGNGAGYAPYQLNEPGGLVYNEADQIFYISNHDSNSVTQWYIGDYEPRNIYAGIPGRAGNSSAQFFFQGGISMDKYGNLYVADSQNNRIQLFCPDAVFGQTIAGTGESGNGATELNDPTDVVLDADLNLYVSDTFNGRVQKFMRIQ